MKRIASFFLFVLILTGCTDKSTIRINGNFKTKDHKKVYLGRIDVDTYVKLDSAKIRRNGNFSFKLKGSDPEFYEVGVSQTDFVTLLAAPGEKIKLSFTGKNFSDEYDVTGSEGTSKLRMLDNMMAQTRRKIDSLRTEYDKVSNNPALKAKEDALINEYVQTIKAQRTNSIKFILANMNSFASIKALYQRIDDNTSVFSDSHDLQFFKLVSDTLTFHYPNSKQAKALKRDFEKGLNQMFLARIENAAKNAPEIKLDPNLKDINGKRVLFSSFKGKYILLSFWASVSEDCVAENLDFKQLYKIYKSRGFEIYQVSLDQDAETWKKAVKFDELPWISVIEDDPKKAATARLYNVQGIPSNYLYDKLGNIIGKDLHGKNLQLKLNQLFGN
jgi:peroxiredoxin